LKKYSSSAVPSYPPVRMTVARGSGPGAARKK
jgi:hypothetical protein